MDNEKVFFLNPDEYQTKVNIRFGKFAVKIKKLIPESRIEHIGSSAIPGSLSKGDLDIYVGVDKDSFDEAIKVLERNDFKIKQNTLRTGSLCMLEHIDPELDIAIQLVENGSEFQDFLRFRDLLVKNRHLLEKYNELKKSCSGLLHSTYRERKAEFISLVLSNKF